MIHSRTPFLVEDCHTTVIHIKLQESNQNFEISQSYLELFQSCYKVVTIFCCCHVALKKFTYFFPVCSFFFHCLLSTISRVVVDIECYIHIYKQTVEESFFHCLYFIVFKTNMLHYLCFHSIVDHCHSSFQNTCSSITSRLHVNVIIL